MRSVVSVLINNVLVFALGLVYTVISARMLGPDHRGILVVAVLVPTWLATLSLLGLPQSLVFNLSRSEDVAAGLSKAIAISIRYLAVAVVLAAAMYAVVARTPILRGMPLPVMFGSMCLCGAMLAEGVVLSFLAGLQDFPWRNAVALLRPLLIALALTGLWLSKTPLTPLLIVNVMTGSALLAFALGAGYLAITYRPAVQIPIPGDWLQSYFWYGLKFYSATVAQAVNYRLDTLIVNAQLGSKDVGLYSAGVGAAEFLLFIPVSVGFVFFPKITAARDEARNNMTFVALGMSLYLVVSGGIILTAFLPWLLPFMFGQAFRAAVVAAQWLVPGMVALTIVRIISYASAGVGKPEYATYTTLVGVLVTVPLDFLLIPRFGITGAAIASTVAYCASAATSLALYMRLRRISGVDALDGAVVAPVRWLKTAWRLRAATASSTHG